MFKKLFKDIYLIFTLLLAIIFVILKIPYLHLPYYWDEAWSYSFPINYMYNHTLNILPTSIPPELSFGHPLLFHFLEALWMKIFGCNLIAAKSFPLLVSFFLILFVYLFCKKFFDKFTGFISVIILCCNTIFITQSTFVLPEMLLALFTLSTFYFFFSNKRSLFIISSILLGLTKESGLVLVILIFIWLLVIFFKSKNFKFNLKNSALMNLIMGIIPLLLISVYYIIQKIAYGWFFLPRHIGYITFVWETFKFNFYDFYFPILFLDRGQNIISVLFLVAVIFFFLIRNKLEPSNMKIIIGLFIFILSFFIFSSINFVSPRYVLCLVPLVSILYSFFIISAFRKYKIILILILISVISIELFYAHKERNEVDINLGYADMVKIDQKIISFCVNEHLQNKCIYTHFLMQKYMTSTLPGYIKDKNNLFKCITNQDQDFKDVDYCIFSNLEYNPIQEKFKKENSLKLLYSVHNGQLWAEVYQIIK